MEQKYQFSHNVIWRIALTIPLIALITVLFVLIGNHKSYATSDGSIIVLVNDKDNNIVSKEIITYKKDDTLYNLINNKYSLKYDLTSYGHYLKGIKGDTFSIETDGKSSWLWFELFYLNDDASFSEDIDFNNYKEQSVTKGIDEIDLVDNMIFAINERDQTHESSVLVSSNIHINTNQNTMFIISIVLVSILSLFIVSYFIYDLIKNKKANPLTIKDITLMVCFSALLFVQEELLTFIPSVQFTFMLIILFGASLGPKRSLLIVLVHVLLDNLFMSSFTIFTIAPMLIGYSITALGGYYLKNKSEYVIALYAGLCAIIYSALFIPINIFVYNINLLTYVIADIPFVAVMVVCNILTVILLYKPLYNVIDSNFNLYYKNAH